MISVPKPKTPKTSLRYELICGGAVRKYPNGREICQFNKKGLDEYRRRLEDMIIRQHGMCCICKRELVTPSFEHSAGRGMGGGHRDDRIWDGQGGALNGAACWGCNSKKGSVRA